MKRWLSLYREALVPIYGEREADSVYRLALEHVTGKPRLEIMMDTGLFLSNEQEASLAAILDRLLKHEPIQYIIGETEFYGLRMKVGPGVLIPRGETEELVEWVLRTKGWYYEGKSIENKVLRVLDIGCGSGAIAIALAKNMPEAEVYAADISDSALEFTRSNARLNEVSVSTFYLDILNPDPCLLSLDVIVSNPPYVAEWDRAAMARNVLDYEPHVALFAPGEDPLVFYRAISGFAAGHLVPGGSVYVEINEGIGEKTAEIFRGCFKNVELRKDINGKDRMIRATNG